MYQVAVLLLAGSASGFMTAAPVSATTARSAVSMVNTGAADFRFGTGPKRPGSLGGTGLEGQSLSRLNENADKETFRFGTGRVVPVSMGGNGLKGSGKAAAQSQGDAKDKDWRFGTGRVDPVPLGGV